MHSFRLIKDLGLANGIYRPTQTRLVQYTLANEFRMALKRIVGRLCGDRLGFPPECAAYAGSALLPCEAELRRKQCLLCFRDGDLPMPAAWYGPGWNIVGQHSVQVVRERLCWAVVCFLPSRMVNPRFPVIRVPTKQQAIDYAHLRAAQLRPGKRIIADRDESQSWKCGDLLIWVAPNA